MVNQQRLLFGLGILGIYFFAAFLQQQLFLNWDVAYHLHMARLLLQGGTYSKDFFAPNLPIILYLYLPPLFLQKYAHLSLPLAFRTYIFVWASISLGISASLTALLFKQQDGFKRALFLLSIACSFLLIPLYDFGQRDHLLLLFSLPYLLLVALRLEKHKIAKMFALTIGVLAGFGFAIKPQFLLLPLILEAYFMYREKNAFAWWRAEVAGFLAVIFTHALLVFLFYTDYVVIVAPFLVRNYYHSIGTSLPALLGNKLVLFCYSALFFGGVLQAISSYKKLNALLMLGIVAFLLIYILQRTTFYYHLIPAFGLSLVLLSLGFSQGLDYYRATARFGRLLVGFLPFLVLVQQLGDSWAFLIYSPATFFSFLGLLFCLLFINLEKATTLWQLAGKVLVVLAPSYLCFYLALRTPFFASHFFLITLAVALSLAGLLATKKTKSPGKGMLLALIGVVLFFYPVYFSYSIFWRSVLYKERVLNGLLSFMKTQPPHSAIYVLSLAGNYSSPLFEYSESHLVQRFDCLWPTLGFLKSDVKGISGSHYAADKQFYMNMIADDLYLQKPDLVFVDERDSKLQRVDPHFDYLVFFKGNEKFREVWKSYRYLTEVEAHPYYKLAVFRRV